jgi:hypothetical protein
MSATGACIRHAWFMVRLALVALLLALAVPSSAPAGWTPAADVPKSKDGVLSRVAVSRNGTVGVAWGDAKVAIRRRDGGWLPVRAMHVRGTTATSPDIAFDARGHLLAVWTESPARPGRPLEGPFQIRLREWTPGLGWGGVRVLGRSGHFVLAQPRLATNARADAVVSWRGFRREGRHLVETLASSLRVAGGHFGRERDAAGGGPYRDVALDRGGNVFGVYTTYAGPRNYFVYQPRGRGWRKPVRLPDSPASKPRIAVGADRTAVIAWRGAAVDSEGDGIQAGPPAAIMRSAGGGFTFPFRLSAGPVTEINVVSAPGSNYLLTWAEPEFLEPRLPGALDLRYTTREEGNALGTEMTVPGARMGPSAFLADGDAIVVYGADGEIRAIRRRLRTTAMDAPETIARPGLWPSLAANGNRAVVTWLDPVRSRLRVAQLAQ